MTGSKPVVAPTLEQPEARPPDTKKCPFCAEEIKYAAIKCRYCHEMLGSDPADSCPPGFTHAAPLTPSGVNRTSVHRPVGPTLLAQDRRAFAPDEYDVIRVRPDPLWEDAKGWQAAARAGGLAILVGVLLVGTSAALSLLFIVLGVAGIGGWWMARSETEEWTREGGGWIGIGRVLGVLFRLLLVLTILGAILGYVLSNVFSQKERD